MTPATRDPDPGNQLGSLPADTERQCAERGAVWARLHARPGRPALLVTACVPTAVIACDALWSAHQAWLHDGAGLAVKAPVLDGGPDADREGAAAALGHVVPPVLVLE